MKKLMNILLLILPFTLFGQIIDDFPKDENGKLNYNSIVSINGADQGELYLRSKKLFIDIFKSGKDVIQLDDKGAGMLIGKGFSDIQVLGATVQMWYSLKIQSKAGRYKYEIYDVYFKKPGDLSGFSAEVVFDRKSYYKKNGEPRESYVNYRNEVQANINNILASVKRGMDKSVEW